MPQPGTPGTAANGPNANGANAANGASNNGSGGPARVSIDVSGAASGNNATHVRPITPSPSAPNK